MIDPADKRTVPSYISDADGASPTTIAAAVLSPCVCGSDEIEPYISSVDGDAHEVVCEACDRTVFASTKADAIAMWRAVSTHDALEAERAAWQKESAMLLAACQAVAGVFQDYEDMPLYARKCIAAIAGATK